MARIVESESIDTAVGQRIATKRIGRNWTQRDLAEKVGVAYQQIQKYESGKNQISVSRLWKIAEVLDVEVGELFPSREVAAVETTARKDAVAIRHETKLMSVFSRIPSSDNRRRVIRFAETLAAVSAETTD